ncbi:hypothetical protein BDU57DRAFT_576497 [Ampelomyces quisqualis]|uniref:Uncharacterized protein n=1 Tax=Ampelomyces quisqualis TaxID=50730 RepID=A0A6A5QHV5_AMPQU|nr:hypothetical protein BDU57DRAFT_576497 [Ampelomyces quisqualis]
MADRGRGRGQRGRRGGAQDRGGADTADYSGSNSRICFDFKSTGSCKRTNCRYSHELGSGQTAAQDDVAPTRVQETPEQLRARQSYSSWKRHLGSDKIEIRTMDRLWKGALEILEEGDRDRCQQLPKDLDTDDKKHKGRHHIAAVMSTRVQDGNSEKFLTVCQRFLLTVTHSSLLDGMAVDTYVGSIYNFMSGANGTRAIPFFQHLCKTLVAIRTDDQTSAVSSGQLDLTLVAMSAALHELLKRESRARFNNELEILLNALETAAGVVAPEKPSITSTLVFNHVRGMRAMVARAKGLLYKDVPDVNELTLSAPASSYPRDLVIPSDRHDNDKLDMTEIVIFPTRDEIMSSAREFLPYTDPDQPHFLDDPAQRHVDTHFRLFRHDVFGELKGTLAGLMQKFMADESAIDNPRLQIGDMRAYSYTGAHISQVVFGRALDIHLSFPLPAAVQNKSVDAQTRWWEESKRLGRGSLLSWIWVQDGIVQHIFLNLVGKGAKDEDNEKIVYLEELITITARMMTHDRATLELLMRASVSRSRGVLLEFPNIMPATFVPILENLQDIQSVGGMPFQQWIVPNAHTRPSDAKIYHDIPPPLYARHAGFVFPMKTIARGIDDSFSVQSSISCNDNEVLNQLEAKTSLDRGQCQALLAALTREFAFIQGPPGTGKSYLGLHLMRVLLDVKKQAKLGPILVVCYTNHALDQFLDHLLEVGVTKIIRVGSQSKSKALANHNLQYLRKSEPNSKAEKAQAWQAYHSLDDFKNNANDVLRELRHLHGMADWHNLKAHISEEYGDIYCQFREEDEEGFQVVGRHPFDIWRTTGAIARGARHAKRSPPTPIPMILNKAVVNVWSLSYEERCRLINHWVEEIHKEKVDELFETVDGAASTQKNLDNVHNEASRRLLQGADVIGMTTSGLAGRISLLKHVACKVLICEEAGEILEPHMISALLPTIEHCIQIGDHEQLRPSVSNFDDLSLESARGKLHQLDKSQFERLSVGEVGRPLVPIAQLNVQRRMRPEISTLIRETIYKELLDHKTTADMPDVVGMRNNVFWLDHSNFEDAMQMDIQHNKSKTNLWEVAMVHTLVRHIVRQGVYESSDIAVLTPYTGQLQKLRAAMRSDFEIVLSDRDQEALEKDGFKIDETHPEDEQIAAALEHGRKPLEKKQLSELLRVATVDNFQGEEAKVVIVSLVRSNKKRNVGFLKTSNRINVLLSRAKHGMYLIGNTETYSAVDMWQDVINMLRAKDSVGETLDLCCPRHRDKIMKVREPDDFARLSPEGGCREACVDRLDCGHSCRSRCHSEAMHTAFQCEEACQRHHQPCGHACQKDTCGEPCGKCMIKVDNVKLPCGHVHDGIKCYMTLDLASIPCHIQVPKQVPGCKHDIVVSCCQDVTHAFFRCPTPCKSPLPCGHACPGTCGRCNTKDRDQNSVVKHFACTEKCKKKMGTCRHNCDRLCHDGSDCGLCQKPCDACGMHSDEQPDMILMQPYSEIDLDELPIVALECGHFFTVETLNGHIDLKEVYKQDKNTLRYVALVENAQLAAKVPRCPTCREPIRQHVTQRYNRIINKAVVGDMTMRFVLTSQQELQKLELELNTLGEVLDGSRQSMVPHSAVASADIKIRDRMLEHARYALDSIDTRYVEANRIEQRIQAFQQRTSIKYQPSNKLHEATFNAINKDLSLDQAFANLSMQSTDTVTKYSGDARIEHGGHLLHMRIQCLVLEDKLEIARSAKKRLPIHFMLPSTLDKSLITQTNAFLNNCLILINSCTRDNLPKLAVEATLYHSRIAQLLGASGLVNDEARKNAEEHRQMAKELLRKALILCEQPFKGADTLAKAVDMSLKLLGMEFYAEVTKEEIEAIKQAMISGPGGMSTHSGHWYKCVNGHPFAIGECGMPMENARCPECGKRIGGQNHQAVEGVTRADNMEH